MEYIKQQWKAQGYEDDQIQEIEEGLKSGIDVSIYAHKKFLAIQMRQIRLGLEDGLDVTKYARVEYDWFQMEEIRKGLVGNINVDLYAFPEVSYDRMHQIRWGLCDGIDLSNFKKMDAGILKELRLAVQRKVNIVPYITTGYDAEQLEAIRMSMEKGLDINPYLRQDYRGISIHEIRLGLEEGVDVSIYAKPDYCWQQMREIRLGLEHRVDVEQYSNSLYSWRQMKEIRLGMEDGLDISYYKSFIYTSHEMQKRRIALQKDPMIAFEKVEIPPIESEIPGNYRITVSPDEMEVYIEVFGSQHDLHRTDILKRLKDSGVVYGIRYDTIEEIVKGNAFRKPILIAKGVPGVDGEDGWYEYFFRTEVARTPKVLPQGNVDYRNVEWFETVEKGQKLAYYHSATQGENGISVTGKTIPTRRGREQNILVGNGFRRLEDGRTYIATVQGIVTISGFHLEVSNVLVMDEVNLATGDVNFEGNVYIRGSVSSGAKIRATGDVVVEGFVETADIVCDGNAVLKQGMNPSGDGSIHAGKDVVGCFFEAAKIDAGGSIYADYFLNCKMHTEHHVYVTGRKGMLAGGSTFAEKGIRTFNLGNQIGLATHVKLGSAERLMKKEHELNEIMEKVKEELFTLGNALLDFQRRYKPEVRNTMEIYLKIESAVYTKEKEIEELLGREKALEEEKKSMELVNIIVDNQLYEGVTIEIDGALWKSKSVRGVVIKKKYNKIALYSKQRGTV